MAPRGQIYRLSDRTLGGTLEHQLRAWRADGLSYSAISDRLRDQGIEVTGETVRRWCNALTIPKGASAVESAA